MKQKTTPFFDLFKPFNFTKNQNFNKFENFALFFIGPYHKKCTFTIQYKN